MMAPFVFICWLLPYRLQHDGSEVDVEDRGEKSKSQAGQSRGMSLWTEVHTIMNNNLFIVISLGYAAYCAVLAGLSTFGPTFFQGLQLFNDEKSASLHFSAIVGLAGLIGTPVGGYLSDKLAGGNASRADVLKTCLRIMSVSSTFGLIFAIAAAYCRERYTFLGFMGTAIMMLFLPTGCCTMAVMEAVPTEMRASAVALNILIMHILGDVPSPVAVGALKDWLAPHCNTKTIGGQEVLNPECVEDEHGLRLTLVICLGWLAWTVFFWTLPLVFPEACGQPATLDENQLEESKPLLNVTAADSDKQAMGLGSRKGTDSEI